MGAHLHHAWLETLRRDPAAIALVDAAWGKSWSRAEIDALAGAWRSALPSATPLAGRIVLFALPNGPGWLAVFLGLLAAEAIPVALDAQEPLAAQQAIGRAIGAAWLWHHDQLLALPAGQFPAPPAGANSPCLLKLTSGSTGTPKAIPFTHAQMLADGRQVCATMGIAPTDVNIAVIPFGHSYGLGNLVVPFLAQGTVIVCAGSPLPHAFAAECARWRPTVFPAVPALLRALASSDLDPAQLASLRVVISAGAPLPAAAAQEFAGRLGHRIHNFYGSSETGGICYDRDGTATLEGRSVGLPLDGVSLQFGEERRFTITSAAVTDPGSFLASDLAELNAQGELVLLGRADRGVKIAGRRLDLGEVESALLAVAGVREAYVMPHPGRPESLAAAVAAELTAETIRRELAGKLAAWKIPVRLVVLTRFPVTARGKPDTSALKAALGVRETRKATETDLRENEKE